MSLGIVASIFAAGIFLISVSFLMYGAAVGLGTVFVAQPWLGWILIGGFFLLGSLLFFKIYFSKKKKAPSDISKMSGALIQKLIDATDLKEWIRKHPYQSTGAAAAAGFIAAGKEKSEITDILKEVLLPLLVEYLQSEQKSGSRECE